MDEKELIDKFNQHLQMNFEKIEELNFERFEVHKKKYKEDMEEFQDSVKGTLKAFENQLSLLHSKVDVIMTNSVAKIDLHQSTNENTAILLVEVKDDIERIKSNYNSLQRRVEDNVKDISNIKVLINEKFESLKIDKVINRIDILEDSVKKLNERYEEFSLKNMKVENFPSKNQENHSSDQYYSNEIKEKSFSPSEFVFSSPFDKNLEIEISPQKGKALVAESNKTPDKKTQISFQRSINLQNFDSIVHKTQKKSLEDQNAKFGLKKSQNQKISKKNPIETFVIRIYESNQMHFTNDILNFKLSLINKSSVLYENSNLQITLNTEKRQTNNFRLRFYFSNKFNGECRIRVNASICFKSKSGGVNYGFEEFLKPNSTAFYEVIVSNLKTLINSILKGEFPILTVQYQLYVFLCRPYFAEIVKIPIPAFLLKLGKFELISEKEKRDIAINFPKKIQSFSEKLDRTIIPKISDFRLKFQEFIENKDANNEKQDLITNFNSGFSIANFSFILSVSFTVNCEIKCEVLFSENEDSENFAKTLCNELIFILKEIGI